MPGWYWRRWRRCFRAGRETNWNACQRQFLIDGWMHKYLRTYGKRLIAMTPSPEAAWATACYLNDRLSLDGRDPSTYGNIAAMFGDSPHRTANVRSMGASQPGLYGSTRRREGGNV
ncbi:hypothetical protein AB5I41_08925 [Sphingomonas sp. MMS24-JH45]